MSRSALICSVLIVLGVLALISCKSDEQQLLDWYHESNDDIKSGLPPREVCDRWLPAYSAMIRDVEIAGEQFQSELDHVLSLQLQGYITPDQGGQMRKQIATAHSAWLRSRNEAFWDQTQIPEPAQGYCFRRLVHLGNTDGSASCSDAAQTFSRYRDNDVLYKNWELSVFTMVEYCLEYWPGFLETG